MTDQNLDINELIRILADHTKFFFNSELGIEISNINLVNEALSNLKLSYLTSLISINSYMNMFFAFSFEKDLIYRILENMTDGLDYPAEEEDAYLEEAASEMLNIVVGNSTASFAPQGNNLSISAPIVIAEAKSIIRNDQAVFYSIEIETDAGMLYIYLIRPKHLFDNQLNYLENKDMNNLSVMIVDDSLIAIRKLTKIFESLGHTVVASCQSGEEACPKYLEVKPDLVTMDITMSDMDGIQATKNILANDPNALVVMVTSHGQEQMVIDAVESGAKGYILKPFNQEKIAESVEKVINKYKT